MNKKTIIISCAVLGVVILVISVLNNKSPNNGSNVSENNTIDQKQIVLQKAVDYCIPKGFTAVMQEPYGQPNSENYVAILNTYTDNNAVIAIMYKNTGSLYLHYELQSSGEWQMVKENTPNEEYPQLVAQTDKTQQKSEDITKTNQFETPIQPLTEPETTTQTNTPTSSIETLSSTKNTTEKKTAYYHWSEIRAVIVDQDPSSSTCKYKEKCEFCGHVMNTTRSCTGTSGHSTSRFTCTEGKKGQEVSIGHKTIN